MKSRTRAPLQLSLPTPRTWGGRRAGAGRKRIAPRPLVPHGVRPAHAERHPVHVTLRRRADLPSLRGSRLYRAVRGALSKSSKPCFRVLHFPVQGDHLHLIGEATDRMALSHGMRGLAIWGGMGRFGMIGIIRGI